MAVAVAVPLRIMTRVTRTGAISAVAAAAAVVAVVTDTGARALIGAERVETYTRMSCVPDARLAAEGRGARNLLLVGKTRAEAQALLPQPQERPGRSLRRQPAHLSPRQKRGTGTLSPSNLPEEQAMGAPRGLERREPTRRRLQGMRSVRRTITYLCRRRRWSSTTAWEGTTCSRPWKISCPILPCAEIPRP